MNSRALLLLVSLLASVLVRASGPLRTADAVLHAASIAVRPVQLSSGGQNYFAGYTTSFGDFLDDEVAVAGPIRDGAFTASLQLVFLSRIDPLTGEPPVLFPSVVLGAPTSADSDLNGVPDFYQVERSVAGEVTGGIVYVDNGLEVSRGTLTATWNRLPGVPTGTVSIQVRIADYGVNLTFLHPFEITVYTGSLNYRRDGGAVSGNLSLSRVGGSQRLSGALNLVRTNASELGFLEGGLTDDVSTFRWNVSEGVSTRVERLAEPPSAYLARLNFLEASPLVPLAPQYLAWDLHLLDRNDADVDGVPDLSDEAASGPGAPPGLRIAIEAGQAVLTLLGETGGRYGVESSAGISGFTLLQQITLSGTSVVIPLGPVSATQFFRARAL